MPIYEYVCRHCGHDFETILKTTDPAPPCPKCHQDVEKKVSLSAFHLKGSGWYKDLYAGKDNNKGGTDSASTAAAAPEGGTSKESKAEASSSTPPASTPAPTAPPSAAPASSTPSSSAAPA